MAVHATLTAAQSVATLAPLQDAALERLIAGKETALREIKATYEHLYEERCTILHEGWCNASLVTPTDRCGVSACGNYFPGNRGFNCTTRVGNNEGMCGSQCRGLVRSLNTSTLLYPRALNMTDPEVQAFTCSSHLLDSNFTAQYTAGTITAWIYIGNSATGAFRQYPGAPQTRTDRTTCADYDPRIRPWYIAASSGPKDIIVLLDVSGSMAANMVPGSPSSGTRMESALKAVRALISSAEQNDRILIVAFNQGARYVGNSKVTSLFGGYSTNLTTALATLEVGGGSNYIFPFTYAFDAIENSIDGANCNTVIQFITDGFSSDSLDILLPEIARRQQRLVSLGRSKAVIFTYSMGAAADHTKPRAIACDNEGVWDILESDVSPLSRMRGYFESVAAAVRSDSARWSSVYTDAFGLGEMVTAALPIYRQDPATNSSYLVAVLGTDVPLADFGRSADETKLITDSLYRRSGGCTNFSLDECALQLLRQRSPSGYVCPSPAPALTSCGVANTTDGGGSTTDVCAALDNSNLNSVICDSMRNTEDRLAVGIAMTTAETACCARCLDGDGILNEVPNATSFGLVGRLGANQYGEPLSSAIAISTTLASVLALIVVFIA